MGDGQLPTMKYHYFHGRFTYSVKRSGRRPIAGLLGRAIVPFACSSCVEACAVWQRGGLWGWAVAAAGFLSRELAVVAVFSRSLRASEIIP